MKEIHAHVHACVCTRMKNVAYEKASKLKEPLKAKLERRKQEHM